MFVTGRGGFCTLRPRSYTSPGGGQEKLKKFKPKERNMWPDRAKKEKEKKSEVREKNL